MSQRTRANCDTKDSENDTDRSLFSRIVEGVIVFFISALLLKLGIEYILSVRIPLIIIAIIATTITIGWRIHKWKRGHDDY